MKEPLRPVGQLPHALFVLLVVIFLAACDVQSPSELQTNTSYQPAEDDSQNAAETAEQIGAALGIEDAKPAQDLTDAAAPQAIEVSTTEFMLSDSGLLANLVGQVTVTEGNQVEQLLWQQTLGTPAQILNAKQAQTQAILPRVSETETLEFTLMAADTQGRVAESRLRIRVLPLEANAQSPLSQLVTLQAPSEQDAGQMLVTIELPEPPTAPVTVNYTTQDGTAIAGQDYEQTQGQLILSADSQSEIHLLLR